MKKVIGIVLAMTAPFALTACQGADALKLFNEVKTKGKEISEDMRDKAAKGLDEYCEITPESTRLWIREDINGRTEKATITVDCAE